MLQRLRSPVLSLLPIVLPIAAIALARVGTHTSWAEANAGLAAILFAWIVADALLLGVLAKAKDHKPAAFSVVAALALAAIIILFGAAGPVRAVYIGLPQVLAAAGGTLALFLAMSAWRLARGWRESGSLMAGLEQVFPPALLRFAKAELAVLWLGLAHWNGPADVPTGSRAFIYHTYLTPMIATFVVLQVIEMSVLHLLLVFWNPTVAWIMFALSCWGLIWSIALMKSFRINPVLLSESHLRVRSGMLYDFEVPLDAIRDAQRPFSTEELSDRHILDLALMSSPNVSIRFARPIAIPTAFGGERMIEGVGLRLDDSAAFLAALERRD
jgi:hypothetical protein